MTEFGIVESQIPPWLQVYLWLLIGCGVVCLIILYHKFRNSTLWKSTNNLSGWSIPWTDFGLIIWLMFFSVFILQLILSLLFRMPQIDESSTQTWHTIFTGLAMQLGIISSYAYIRKTQPELFLDKINCKPLSLLPAAAIAGFIFLASFPTIALTSYFWQNFLFVLQGLGLDISINPQDIVLSMKNAPSFPAMISMTLLAIVGAPIVEELVFRGSLYRFLKFRMSKTSAVLISAGVFASIHSNLTGFFPLLILGIFLCLSYEISGNLKVPILMHAIFNLNSVFLIFSLK